MVLRPGLDLDRGFDVAGYFGALRATLARGATGAAPGTPHRPGRPVAAPAERARSFMQQWLDRTAPRTPWGARPSALCAEETDELLGLVEELGHDPVRYVKYTPKCALEGRAAELGLTVADLVQLVTTDLLARHSGGIAPNV